MTFKEFNGYIEEAYKDRTRSVQEAANMLHIESGELAELFMKQLWYNKAFKLDDLLSESGDILNFLTYILSSYNLTLEDAMANNISKLKNRGWISL